MACPFPFGHRAAYLKSYAGPLAEVYRRRGRFTLDDVVDALMATSDGDRMHELSGRVKEGLGPEHRSEYNEFMREAHRAGPRLVRALWPDITSLAKELLRRPTLDRDDARMAAFGSSEALFELQEQHITGAEREAFELQRRLRPPDA